MVFFMYIQAVGACMLKRIAIQYQTMQKEVELLHTCEVRGDRG